VVVNLAAFVASAFLASALIFSLEPMVGKLMLPLLGGSPAIWNTCLLFFQAMLLAGYAYAHYGIRLLGVRRHAVLHVALLAVSLLALPPGAGEAAPPADSSPVLWLLLLLLRSIGLPFFALSATAPLVQRWLAGSTLPGRRDPYFLYAASNIGSLTGLALYPFVLEPLTGLRVQALGWSAVYVGFVALVAAVAAGAARRQVREVSSGVTPPVSALTATRWTALAFLPSALLLAVTGYITTDLAPMPLLWLLPLALYLGTFVAAFGVRDDVADRWVHFARVRQPVVTVAVLTAVAARLTPLWMILVHVAALALAAYLAHARLAAERPPPARLTAFYLWIGIGGTLGGVFGVLVAPLLFMPDTEYVLLLLAALLLPTRASAGAPVSRGTLYALPVLAAAVAVATLASGRVAALIVLVPLVVLLLRTLDAQRVVMAAVLALAMSAASPLLGRAPGQVEVASRRNFFGTVRISDAEGYRRFTHGSTIHGAQSLDPARAFEPTAYYGRGGPLGDMFDALHERTDAAHIGVVGLGIGTAVCYSRPADTWQLFEIDPDVVAFARDPRYFSFLAGCAPDATVVIGDGRRALDALANSRFDLLIIDAFSSDAIPPHMITREAFALYMARLAPDGLLAVHISNRYLDLSPVVAANVRDLGLHSLVRGDPGEPGLDRMSSTWVAVGSSASALAGLGVVEGWQVLRGQARFRTWTDDYTNVLGVVRAWR
jgi:hypothetical protein